MSGFGELANAIQIVNGAAKAIDLVYRAYEAIKDVHRQIEHLRSMCELVKHNINSSLRILRGREKLQWHDEAERQHYNLIFDIAGTVVRELEDLEAHIYSPERLSGSTRFRRLVHTRAFMAAHLKVNINVKALKRIESMSAQLQWATDVLQYNRAPTVASPAGRNALRNFIPGLDSNLLDFDPGTNSPSREHSPLDDESREKEEEYRRKREQISSSTSRLAKDAVARSLASGTQTPEAESILTIYEEPTPLNLAETHVSAGELQHRFEEAQKLASKALQKEFPDVAADFHGQAIEFYNQQHDGGEPRRYERADLEANHIRILIKCLHPSLVLEGKERLKDLAADANRLTETNALRPMETHSLCRDIGRLYMELGNWSQAIRFLRSAIFEPTFLQDYPGNKPELNGIAREIIKAYDASMQVVKIQPFRNALQAQLGENPMFELREFRDAVEWCRMRKFKVGNTNGVPSFSEERDADGDFPLHKAVRDLDTNATVIKQLASDENSLNARGQNGLTPLLLAVERSRRDAVEALLEAGASLDIRTLEKDMEETALHLCSDPGIMKLLLDKLQTRRLSTASCTIPIEADHIDLKRIDINSHNLHQTETALHKWCRGHDWPMVRVLLAHGADPNAKDYLNETPLIFACCYSAGKMATTRQIVQALMSHGAEVDQGGRERVRDALKKKGFKTKEIAKMLQPRTNELVSNLMGTSTHMS